MGNLRERPMTSSVYVAGVGMIPSSSRARTRPTRVMGAEATGLALADAGVSYDMIQQAYVGYVYGDSTCGQRALYSVGMTRHSRSSTSTTIARPARPRCSWRARRSDPARSTAYWRSASSR